MGKIASLMEASLAGLTNVLEFRHKPSNSNNVAHMSAASEKTAGFLSFVLRGNYNFRYLNIAVVGAIIQFTVFKVLYPYPDFISDSYSYIETNLSHLKVNLWPIGYSKFLAGVHAISPSDNFLVFCQYAVLTGALLYFFFSIRYLFRLSKPATVVLFIFLFFNPAFLYLSNAVLSDTLFLALSLVLFTQIMHLLHRPKYFYIFSLALLTGVMFTLRYTAIYYPVAAIPVFLLSRLNKRAKVLGILAPLVFIIPFVIYTKQCTKEATGTAEFSVFGGWQIANNALYMYDHINLDTTSLPPAFLPFDRMVRDYLHRKNPSSYELQHFPGTWYIKHQDAPLKSYMLIKMGSPISSGDLKDWGRVSPIYNAYGTYLIKNNLLAFAQYYLLLNAQNYFIPHLEIFATYNMGGNYIWSIGRNWFPIKKPFITAVSWSLPGNLFFVYPTLFLLLNVYFIFLFLQFVVTKRFKKATPLVSHIVIASTVFLFLNFCFSVFATPVVLRYQLFPMVLLLTCILLIINKKKPDSQDELAGQKLNTI